MGIKHHWLHASWFSCGSIVGCLLNYHSWWFDFIYGHASSGNRLVFSRFRDVCPAVRNLGSNKSQSGFRSSKIRLPGFWVRNLRNACISTRHAIKELCKVAGVPHNHAVPIRRGFGMLFLVKTIQKAGWKPFQPNFKSKEKTLQTTGNLENEKDELKLKPGTGLSFVPIHIS